MTTDLRVVQQSYDQCLSYHSEKGLNQTALATLQQPANDKFKLRRLDALALARSKRKPSDDSPTALKRSNTGLDLCRSDGVIWCRGCRHRNEKHAIDCAKCGDTLHGEVDPTGQDDQVGSLGLSGAQFTGFFDLCQLRGAKSAGLA